MSETLTNFIAKMIVAGLFVSIAYWWDVGVVVLIVLSYIMFELIDINEKLG